MLERPSVVVVPDLKGELDTSELPVTCLKLELVLLGPPPLGGGTGMVRWLSSASPEEGGKVTVVGDCKLEPLCVVAGRFGWSGDQPLEELAMILSRVGSCFLGVRPEGGEWMLE
jgi:hypothetical protein